jgi:pyruvate-formate lyase
MTPKLSDRLQILRTRVLNPRENSTCYIGQRIYGALEGLVTTSPGMPWMKMRAHILAGVIRHATAIILPEELLVGYNYYGDDATFGWEIPLAKRIGPGKEEWLSYLKKGQLTPDQLEFCADVNDDLDRFPSSSNFVLDIPPIVRDAMMEGLFVAWGTSDTHTIIGYRQVIEKGFQGILKEIDSRLAALKWKNPDSIQKRLVLESCREIAIAGCELGPKYVEKATNLLYQLESSPPADLTPPQIENQKNDLKRIIKICSQVPTLPARTFHEAVQGLWFAHIINTWEDGINANSLGRLDQILYPYYRSDIDAGKLSHVDAFELVGCLWLKLYREYDVQQAILGGRNVNGQDVTNDLTYLMLDVTEALEIIRCLSMRLHAHTPTLLLTRALQVVSKGRGIPFFFNDDQLIPALIAEGIAPQDAQDYAAIGCVEITIPGKANPHAVSNRINLLKCLELALNQGKTLKGNHQLGPDTGPLDKMTSIEDVIIAYQKQVEFFTDLACFESNRCELRYSLTVPMPYKTLLTENCLDSGRDFNAGGAKYNYHESNCMGIPNVADSLESIQTLVFDTHQFTLPEVIQHLKSNFADESVHQLFINRASKYGNDTTRVDQFAVRVFTHFCTYLKTQRGIFGGGFFAQPFTFLWLVEAGAQTPATPDGRRSGENLAYSLSPMQGRDQHGLTAMLNSLAKFPYQLAPGGPSAIVEVDPQLFSLDNFPKMVSVVQSAIEKGVAQMQFNVVNAITLQDAQQHPENYPHLEVRVSGFSQRFILLDRKLQDHIIARIKHQTI